MIRKLSISMIIAVCTLLILGAVNYYWGIENVFLLLASIVVIASAMSLLWATKSGRMAIEKKIEYLCGPIGMALICAYFVLYEHWLVAFLGAFLLLVGMVVGFFNERRSLDKDNRFF